MSVKSRIKRLEITALPKECFVIVIIHPDQNDLSKHQERRVNFWDWMNGKEPGNFGSFYSGCDMRELKALMRRIDRDVGIPPESPLATK